MMTARDLLSPPNLMSLARIVLAPLILYLLYLDTPAATAMAGVTIIIAGITDGLDGYLARRMNKLHVLKNERTHQLMRVTEVKRILDPEEKVQLRPGFVARVEHGSTLAQLPGFRREVIVLPGENGSARILKVGEQVPVQIDAYYPGKDRFVVKVADL